MKRIISFLIVFTLLSCGSAYADEPICAHEPGDVNGDGTVNILDIVSIVNHVLGIVPYSDEDIEACANMNSDEDVDILDIVSVLNVILGIGSDEDDGSDDITVESEERALPYNIGPAGYGRVIYSGVFSVGEGLPDIVFAMTDVGGMYRSDDGGVTFFKRNNGMNTKVMFDLDMGTDDSEEVVLVGTSDGIYRSTDRGDTWELSNTGLKSNVKGSGLFYHPITDVEMAKLEGVASGVVWASIGQNWISSPYRGKDSYGTSATDPTDYGDPYEFYKSIDGGKTWTGMLNLKLGSLLQEYLYTKISIHPTDPDIIYFATSHGFYATFDGGDKFYEFSREGDGIVYVTTNSGESWAACTEEGSSCDEAYKSKVCASDPRFTDPATTYDENEKYCLPMGHVNDTIYPQMKSPALWNVKVHVEGDTTWLYALLNGKNYNPNCLTDEVYKVDNDLDYLVAGPYRSDDGGKTWERLFKKVDFDTTLTRHFWPYVRCQDQSYTANEEYRFISIDPENKDHFFMSGRNQRGGLVEYLEVGGAGGFTVTLRDDVDKISQGTTRWKHLTYSNSSSSYPQDFDCFLAQCFEGRSNKGLSNQSFWEDHFHADWNSVEGFEHDSDTFLSKPELWFSQGRGLSKGAWDEENNRYYFDHVDESPNENDPCYNSDCTVTRWNQTNLTVYSSFDLAFGNDQTLYSAGEDDGAMISKDDGISWSVIPAGLGTDDRSEVALYDKDLDKLYMWREKGDYTNFASSTGDNKTVWTLLGGYDNTKMDDDGNYIGPDKGGLPSSIKYYQAVFDYSSGLNTDDTRNERRILLGTAEGLYLYDSTTSAWTKIEGNGCPGSIEGTVNPDISGSTAQVKAVISDETFKDSDDNYYAFIGVTDVKDAGGHHASWKADFDNYGEINSDRIDGVYLVHLNNLSSDSEGTTWCTKLYDDTLVESLRNIEGTHSPRAVYNLAMGKTAAGTPSLIAYGEGADWPSYYQADFNWNDPTFIKTGKPLSWTEGKTQFRAVLDATPSHFLSQTLDFLGPACNTYDTFGETLSSDSDACQSPLVPATNYGASNYDANVSYFLEHYPALCPDGVCATRHFNYIHEAMAIAVVPNQNHIILLGTMADPNVDRYTNNDIYASYDGGKSFQVAEELSEEVILDAHVNFIKFNEHEKDADGDHETILLGANCSGIVKAENPYIKCKADSSGCWFLDADGDGCGDSAKGVPRITNPSSDYATYVANGEDSDDSVSNIDECI